MHKVADSSVRSRWPAVVALVSLVVVAAMTALLLVRPREPGTAVVVVLIVGVVTAAGAFVLIRGPRPARSVVAIGTGLIGIAEGGGVLFPHLLASGLGIFAVAAAVCLAAGLILLVAGTQDLLAAGRGWWRLFSVPALLVVTVVVMLTVPFAVAATSVPRTPLASRDPGDLGIGYQDVTFPAADGVPLSGWYIASGRQSGAGPAVVLLHGSGSSRSAVLDHAAVLAARGYGVLLYDARGHGESGGTAMDFGWYGDPDVSGAVTFVGGLSGVDSAAVAVVGMSMGGEEAIGAAASDPRIRAVVAEGATNRVAEDKAWQADRYGLAGVTQGLLDQVTYGAAALLTAAQPPGTLRGAAQRAAPRPLLLITAGNRPDEALAADHIRAGSPTTVSVWDVPGADHVGALATDPGQWVDRVDAFLTSARA